MRKYHEQYDCKDCNYMSGILMELCEKCDQYGLVEN